MKSFIPLVCSIVFSLSSFAATQSHKNAAEELISLTNPKETFITAFMVSFEPALDLMSANGLSSDKVEKVRSLAQDLAITVSEDPDLLSGLVGIYVEEFSENEIIELMAFYRTPLGRKTLKKLPVLFERGGAIGEAVTSKYLTEFQGKVSSVIAE